ncbi:hypothetical protein D9M71_242450 [compost metagenome]
MVEIDQPHTLDLRQPLQRRIMAEQQRNAVVFQHVGQAFSRVFRVQRHIGGAGFHHGIQGDDHFHGTQRRHTDQTLAADALLVQVVGELVGALVEFAVAQYLLAEPQCLALGMFLGQAFEQAVHHRLIDLPVAGGAVDLIQQGAVLLIEQGEVADGGVGTLQQLREQVEEALVQALDGRVVEQVGGVVPVARQFARGVLPGMQGQVELRAAAIQRQQACLQARQQLQGLVLALLVVVQHLEQRVVAEAALGLQRFHQLFERQVLVRLGALGCGADLFDDLLEAGLGAQFAAEDLGVDEEADQPFGFRALAAGNGHTDAQVALATEAEKQYLISRQQQGEQGSAALCGQFAQTRHQRLFQEEGVARAAIALAGRARAVGGQFQHRVLIAQALAPVFQLPLALPGLQAGALPQRHVGVVQRQFGQRLALATNPRAVGRDEVGEQHLDRPAVGDDVVQADQQRVLVPGHPHQRDAPQRPLGEVEGTAGELAGQRLQLLLAVHAQVLDGQRAGCLDHLLRRAVLAALEHRAQAGVAAAQAIEGGLHRLDVQRPAQAQRAGQVVAGVAGFQLFEEPQALLGKRRGTALPGHPGRDRQRRGIQPLLPQLAEEDAALRGAKAEKTRGQGHQLGLRSRVLLRHQLLSSSSLINSSRASSRSRVRVCPCRVSISAAWAAMVVASKAWASGRLTPSCSRISDSSRVASRECPPSSKKLSWRPTRSTFSSACQSPASASSRSPHGASKARSCQPGTGSALRSSLPLALRGRRSSSITWAGTMNTGSSRPRAVFSDSADGCRPASATT